MSKRRWGEKFDPLKNMAKNFKDFGLELRSNKFKLA
jgi:hypothetical protein